MKRYVRETGNHFYVKRRKQFQSATSASEDDSPLYMQMQKRSHPSTSAFQALTEQEARDDDITPAYGESEPEHQHLDHADSRDTTPEKHDFFDESTTKLSEASIKAVEDAAKKYSTPKKVEPYEWSAEVTPAVASAKAIELGKKRSCMLQSHELT